MLSFAVDQLYHLHFTSIAKLNLKYHLPQAAGCCLESFEVAFKFSRFVRLGIQESTWCLHLFYKRSQNNKIGRYWSELVMSLQQCPPGLNHQL
jgi:hypothetical protein